MKIRNHILLIVAIWYDGLYLLGSNYTFYA